MPLYVVAPCVPVISPLRLPVKDVAVVALPLNAAVIVPALKLPLPSLATILFPVLADVAVVALLDTLPAVEIVGSCVSAAKVRLLTGLVLAITRGAAPPVYVDVI